MPPSNSTTFLTGTVLAVLSFSVQLYKTPAINELKWFSVSAWIIYLIALLGCIFRLQGQLSLRMLDASYHRDSERRAKLIHLAQQNQIAFVPETMEEWDEELFRTEVAAAKEAQALGDKLYKQTGRQMRVSYRIGLGGFITGILLDATGKLIAVAISQ